MTKVRTNRGSSQACVPVNKQVKIQIQDEGANLGTAGTVDTINFVGTAVTVTRVGDVVTITITGSGSGSGDVTGPASSTDDHLVLFNGATGKIIKDIALSPAALQTVRRNAADNAWEAFTPAAALGYTPPRVLYINTVADSFTGSAAETLRPNYSFTIPGGTLAVGDILQFFLITTKTGTVDTNTTRVYFNTSQTLTSATLIGQYAQGAPNQYQAFTRKIRITGTTTQEFFTSAATGNPTDDIAVNAAQSTAAFDIANDIHFCTAVDLSGTPTDTIVLRGLLVILYR